jgi:hypothetical protein
MILLFLLRAINGLKPDHICIWRYVAQQTAHRQDLSFMMKLMGQHMSEKLQWGDTDLPVP